MSVYSITDQILENQVKEFWEIWKIIAGFPGDPYRVSFSGRVQTRKVRIRWGEWIIGDDNDWRDMSLNSGKHSDLYISLCKDGRVQNYHVHHLVLKLFAYPCPPGQECAHWDGDPTNNHLCNLRWATPKENHEDAVRHGPAVFGDSNFHANISKEIATQIRVEYAQGNCTQTELAEKHGLKPCTVNHIVHNKIWIDPDYFPCDPGSHYVKGEDSNLTKLNWDKVNDIRAKRKAGRTLQSLGDEYEVTKQNIRLIVTNRTWKI